jgi:altronate hydrolase
VNDVLHLNPCDNVLVALRSLDPGTAVSFADGSGSTERSCRVVEAIPAKHKVAIADLRPGDLVFLYGTVVGEAIESIPAGCLLTPRNVRHRVADFDAARRPFRAILPDSQPWAERTFLGFRRADGQVGTRNYWLVVSLVFCENRNVERMKEALEEELGYRAEEPAYRELVRQLVHRQRGDGVSRFPEPGLREPAVRVFPNIDGVRFLTHQGGCGGTRQDAQALCGLLAGYIHNPNVAGATVLSLGCQNAQPRMLLDEFAARDPERTKRVLVFDQQQTGSEDALLRAALESTCSALAEANRVVRRPAPLSALTVGLKCGASDGFSGISANPVVGHLSDLLVGLDARSLLAEFPELHGVEQALIDRCSTDRLASRFTALMQSYAERARAAQSGFEMNASPGNIGDGLITDAMKSVGAARKSGSAIISDVLDFPAYATVPGLNLLCTPGNDVESVTAQVGAGANLVLFTTGLGTPTGNPIAPVLKISTNSSLADRMSDIVDFDAGGILTGEQTIADCAERLLELSIEVASGERMTKAELLGQHDFIPWKRGVSL